MTPTCGRCLNARRECRPPGLKIRVTTERASTQAIHQSTCRAWLPRKTSPILPGLVLTAGRRLPPRPSADKFKFTRKQKWVKTPRRRQSPPPSSPPRSLRRRAPLTDRQLLSGLHRRVQDGRPGCLESRERARRIHSRLELCIRPSGRSVPPDSTAVFGHGPFPAQIAHRSFPDPLRPRPFHLQSLAPRLAPRQPCRGLPLPSLRGALGQLGNVPDNPPPPSSVGVKALMDRS